MLNDENDLYGKGYTDCVLAARAFFFSSRRRHTRSLRDWSSDVCSSDLLQADGSLTGSFKIERQGFYRIELEGPHGEHVSASPQYTIDALDRSEERRVGKECRPRGRAHAERRKRSLRQGLHRLRAGRARLFFFEQKTAYEVST